MPIQQQWDNADKTVYLIRLQPSWQWDDFYAHIQQAYSIIHYIEHEVDIIFCFESDLPAGNIITHMRYLRGMQPANVRQTVIVNYQSHFLELMIKTVDKTMGWKSSLIVTSLEQARHLLTARL